jgi:hypothetical protein
MWQQVVFSERNSRLFGQQMSHVLWNKNIKIEYDSDKKFSHEQAESSPPSHSLIKNNFIIIPASKLHNPNSCLPLSFLWNLPNYFPFLPGLIRFRQFSLFFI